MSDNFYPPSGVYKRILHYKDTQVFVIDGEPICLHRGSRFILVDKAIKIFILLLGILNLIILTTVFIVPFINIKNKEKIQNISLTEARSTLEKRELLKELESIGINKVVTRDYKDNTVSLVFYSSNLVNILKLISNYPGIISYSYDNQVNTIYVSKEVIQYE